MTRLVTICLGALMVCAAAIPCAVAAEQGYPTKPVRFIIAFAPGGAADIIGRVIAAQLTQAMGEQFVVDNRGGAGGVIGAEQGARAKPDGYTLLLLTTAHAINPSFYKLPYDPLHDFTPIARVAVGPSALVVHPSVPVKSVKELVDLAKAQPGKLDFAAAGNGSFTHLGAELFRMLAGIKILIVQYKGAGPATIDLIGGHTQASVSTLSAFMSHIQAGRLRVLGVGSARRSIVMPDVPTIAESGVPGYDASSWFGVAAPAGTPKAIIDRMYKELSVVATQADTKKRLLDQGAEVSVLGPAEFAPYYAAEIAKWGRVVKEGGIKPE